MQNWLLQKGSIFLLMMLTGHQLLFAQEEFKLYAGIPPGNLNSINKEVQVKTDAGRMALTKVSIPSFIYFKATGHSASRASVIICPGGGYHRLSIYDGGIEVAKAFAKAGVHAFVLKYRTYMDSTYENYEQLPFMDLHATYRQIMSNSKKWNIDTSKIGILGFSAGGHLAAMASTPQYKLKLAFNVLVYPVISFADSLVSNRLQSRKMLLGKIVSAEKKLNYSPERFITDDHPASFLIHAMDDSTSLVQNSLLYYSALVKKKIPARLQIYQKGGHGFSLFNREENDSWLPAVLKWLSMNKITTKEYNSITH